jgi:hypothetical protein
MTVTPESLAKYTPLPDLRWLLKYQSYEGVTTRGDASCGHGFARGCGPCVDCVKEAIRLKEQHGANRKD